jgi:hypothetical protein
MQDCKFLRADERVAFRDLGVGVNGIDHDSNSRIHGIVIVRDAETGEILFKKKNLVVRSGREMTLRKIFGIPGSIPGETEADLKEKFVLTFGIGNGGTPNADPFNPLVPTPSDSDLSNPISFRSEFGSVTIPLGEADNYADNRISSGGQVDWYKKVFTNGHGVLTVDPDTDEVYNELELFISSSDARDKFINEIGLYFSKYNPAANDPSQRHTEFKIFSRFTFMTEPMPSATNKALKISYFVYM